MELLLQLALLLFAKGGRFAKEVGYLLFGLSFHYRSEGRLSAISCQVILYHLSMGHFSDAIRSFAQVAQPHLRQRPVPRIPAASHRSQDRQVSIRTARVSGSV